MLTCSQVCRRSRPARTHGIFRGLAKAHLKRNIDFANGYKRTDKLLSAVAGLGRYAWTPNVGPENTKLLISEHLAGNWPTDANIVYIALRTHAQVDDIPTTRPKPRTKNPLPADPDLNDLAGTRGHGTFEEYATPVYWT